MQLVLASSSPRRRELLALLGLSFEISPPEVEERPRIGLSPIEQVAYLAVEKARFVSKAKPHALILGSDTVIELDGQLLGKPSDLDDARGMLARLAGRSHQVHTAVAICLAEKSIELVDVATAVVHMRPDVEHMYERYLATGESFGKAGAYAIQGYGGDLIKRIEGDYTTIVGLPLTVTAQLLESAGYPVPVKVDDVYQRKPYMNWTRFSV